LEKSKPPKPPKPTQRTQVMVDPDLDPIDVVVVEKKTNFLRVKPFNIPTELNESPDIL